MTFDEVVSGFKDFMGPVLSGLGSAGSWCLTGIKDSFSAFWHSAAPGEISSGMGSLGKYTLKAMQEIGEGVIDGAKWVWNAVTTNSASHSAPPTTEPVQTPIQPVEVPPVKIDFSTTLKAIAAIEESMNGLDLNSLYEGHMRHEQELIVEVGENSPIRAEL